MPIIALALLLIVLVLVGIALLPISLVQRYRVGTSRRPARGWFIGLNLMVILLSSGIFLLTAAVTTTWVPDALSLYVYLCSITDTVARASLWVRTPSCSWGAVSADRRSELVQ